MSVEVINVEKPGPYGFLANGVWYGLGKKSGLSPQDFNPGQTYTVDIWTADSGKKYVNKIMSAGSGQAPNAHVPPTSPGPEKGGIRPPAAAGTYKSGGYDADVQERIARNTAYQKATDAVSRLLTPFIAKEEDILPKLKELVEPLAGWLYTKIKNEAGTGA